METRGERTVMKSTGIRRKVDDLGRVVIPAGIRRSLGITEGDSLEVAVDGDLVILAKPTDRCVFCGDEGGALEAFRDRMICRPCLGGLGALDGRLRDGGQTDDARDEGPRQVAGNGDAQVHHLAPPPASDPRPAVDERAVGVRDERREPYDPASTTAW